MGSRTLAERLFYIVIDTCPNNRPCGRTQLIEEHVFVSSPTDGRIYINKRCARCHGENKTLDWLLTVQNCPNVFLTDTASLEAYILRRCFLKLTPPAELEQIIHQYECVPEEDILSVCNKSTGIYQCQTHSVWNRYDFFLYGKNVYASHDCFRCNDERNHPQEICKHFQAEEEMFPIGKLYFSALIDTKVFQIKSQRASYCQGHQVYDSFLVSK